MDYAAEEIPDVEPGPDGVVRAVRDPAEVFRPETVASFEGKPVTDDHPDEDVCPGNWKRLAVGVAQNVRQGEGVQADLLLADLLIFDRAAIAAVRSGLREVSCGYTADYQSVRPGIARQVNIIGNHIALVEQGRCGPRCAIGDRKMPKKQGWADKLRAAFMTRDSDAAEAAIRDAEEEAGGDEKSGNGDTHVHLHLKEGGGETSDAEEAPAPAKKADGADPVGADPVAALTDRVGKIEEGLAILAEAVNKLAGGETQDGADEEQGADGGDVSTEDDGIPDDPPEKSGTATGDGLGALWKETVSRAEILAPGLKLPTRDAKATPQQVRDSLCLLRRRALARALHDESTRSTVVAVNGGREPNITTMTCDHAALLFNGAAEMTRRQRQSGGGGIPTPSASAAVLRDINERNRNFWSAVK
jgi:hypothetical protein